MSKMHRAIGIKLGASPFVTRTKNATGEVRSKTFQALFRGSQVSRQIAPVGPVGTLDGNNNGTCTKQPCVTTERFFEQFRAITTSVKHFIFDIPFG